MRKAKGPVEGARSPRTAVLAATIWVAAAVAAGVSIPGAARGLGLPVSPAVEQYGPRANDYLAEAVYRQPPATAPKKTTTPRRMRTNTIDFGFQISYGAVRGTSRLADGFNTGIGYAFRFRYSIKPSFSLGFSFENQSFDQTSGNPPSTVPGASDSSIVMTTVAAEGIFFVHRERMTNPYFVVGLGHASPDIKDENLGTTRVNEGMFLELGLGLETFVREKLSLDFTLRGYGLVSNSEVTSFLQFCAGFQVYPGD